MYDLKFADIGEGIHEGQILKWYVKVGDKVKEGETLVVIETDKVNAEIPSPVDGIIVKLGAEVGQTIHVGETLVIIDDGSGVGKNLETKDSKHSIEKVEEEGAGVVGELEISDEVIATESYQETSQTSNKVLATPVARKLASDLKIDITKIVGTGENNRVMKTDILNYYEKSKSTVSPATANVQTPISQVAMPPISGEGIRRVKISKLRETIVKAMTTSKAIIPHTTLMDELDVSELVKFRNEQKSLAEQMGVKLTYLPFIIKAVTKTIEEFPIFNSSFDHETNEIIYKDFINIGIAVDTPDGLIVPNIKNANQKSIFQLAKELNDLAQAARDRTLSLDQIQNGTFTITNYGAVNATFGVPVIKYPEVAILGVGIIHKKPIVRDNEIVIADVLPISIAVDHRIIDGADAGRFVMRFKQLLKNPMMLLLS